MDGDGALASRWACLVCGGRRVRAAVVSDAGRAAGLTMLGPDRGALAIFLLREVCAAVGPDGELHVEWRCGGYSGLSGDS
jgi:hypothetical protein